MKKISKPEVILDAFTEALPIGESWYEERLAICSTCPYNSKNVEDKSLLTKIKDMTLGDNCTACGCFIDRKAGRKEEECGLSVLGLPLKWNRLLVHTVGNDFNLNNGSPNIVNIDLAMDGSAYIADYGNVNVNSPMKATFILEGVYPIVSVTSSCGCTTPALKQLTNNSWQVTAAVDLNKISQGVFNKKVFVYYVEGKTKKVVEIRLIGNKNK